MEWSNLDRFRGNDEKEDSGLTQNRHTRARGYPVLFYRVGENEFAQKPLFLKRFLIIVNFYLCSWVAQPTCNKQVKPAKIRGYDNEYSIPILVTSEKLGEMILWG